MSNTRYYFLLACVGLVMLQPAYAQQAEPQNADQFLQQQGSIAPTPPPQTDIPDAPTEQKTQAEEKPQESPDMIAKKLELAREMHQIRPTRVQVDAAIIQAANSLPEPERAAFVTAMKSTLNYNAIEKISVDAMVETFSLGELDAMVSYHRRPEAKSVSDKMVLWAQKVQPEVIRMLDSAMLRVKTGGDTDSSKPPQ